MSLKLNDQIVLVPIGLAHTKEIHDHFTEDVVTCLPVAKLSGRLADKVAFIERSMVQMVKHGPGAGNPVHRGICSMLWLARTNGQGPHFGIWIKKALQGKGIGKKSGTFCTALGNFEFKDGTYQIPRR